MRSSPKTVLACGLRTAEDQNDDGIHLFAVTDAGIFRNGRARRLFDR